jgi:hypothetical protein
VQQQQQQQLQLQPQQLACVALRRQHSASCKPRRNTTNEWCVLLHPCLPACVKSAGFTHNKKLYLNIEEAV